MPNKLTDAEVKKALKCCSTYHDVRSCKNCPLDGKCEPNLLEQYALDQINRLEGEKEKNENIIRIADKTIATLDAENESLKAEVERLKRELNLVVENSLSTRFPHCVLCGDTAILTKNLEGYDKFIADIKAEAYKEFAEKIKEKTKWLFSSVSINNEVDNLLNELVSDGDGKRKD